MKTKIQTALKLLSMQSLKFINFLFQRVFLQDYDCKYSKHFSSRVISANKLYIENNSKPTLKCLSQSGGCYINASGGLYIGEGTIWAFNVAFVTLNHSSHDFNKAVCKGPINIGKNCWIGFGAVLLGGVKLGDNTIVGANAVVTKSFPCGNVVLAGVPARIVKYL